MDYIRKFNPDTTYTPKEGDKLYDIHQKAIKGHKLTKEEKEFITRNLYNVGYFKTTYVRLLGWLFDFSPILHKILVQFTYGDYEVFYAINKTCLRKEMSNIRKMTYVDCDGKVKKLCD